MGYLDNFNLIVGDTILECQRIEHDIKLIYAGMLRGEFADNIDFIKDKTLGDVLKKLKSLDNSDGKPYLSNDDYKLINNIKNIRNWLVHKCYIEFIYESDSSRYENNMTTNYNKLIDFNKKMNQLSNQVERVRIDLLKQLGR